MAKVDFKDWFQRAYDDPDRRASVKRYDLNDVDLSTLRAMASYHQVEMWEDVMEMKVWVQLTPSSIEIMDEIVLKQRVARGNGPRAIQLED